MSPDHRGFQLIAGLFMCKCCKCMKGVKNINKKMERRPCVPVIGMEMDWVVGLNFCLRPLWPDPPSSSSSGAEVEQKQKQSRQNNITTVFKALLKTNITKNLTAGPSDKGWASQLLQDIINQDLTICVNIISTGIIYYYLLPCDESLQLPLVDHKQRLGTEHGQNPVSLEEIRKLQQQQYVFSGCQPASLCCFHIHVWLGEKKGNMV